MSATALVTDAHYRMSLALCRDLAQSGVRVVTCERESLRLDPASPPLGGLSKYVERHVWLPDRNYAQALADLCRELGSPDTVAVLPVGAATLALLASRQEQFRQVCGLCIPTPGQLDLLNDKEAVLRLAEELDIPRPESFSPKEGEPAGAFLARVSLPCVVKPRCGEKLGLTARERYRVARNAGELQEAFERFRDLAGAPPLVQAYLPGAGLGCSLLAQEGRVLASICHRRVREYPVSGGPSSCCETVRRADLEEFAARLVRRTGYTGLCMVEFKEDAAGKPRILEVNPRVWGSFPLTRASRSGIPLGWLQASLGMEAGPPKEPQQRRMIFALSDFLAGVGYLRRGEPKKTLSALADLVNPKVRDGVFEWGDIRPGLAYLRALLAKERKK